MGRHYVLNAALLLLIGAGAASADTIAVGFTSPGTNVTNNDWSLGWEFTANTAVNVTQLGFYDAGELGLSASHAVGIFALDGTLLASGTVNPGDPLDGFFNYTTIAPLTLVAGTEYIVSAVTGSADYTFRTSGLTTDPAITYITDKYSLSSGSLIFPTSSDGDTLADGGGWFGANFQFAPVPEPSGLVLAGIGAASWFLAACRRRKTESR